MGRCAFACPVFYIKRKVVFIKMAKKPGFRRCLSILLSVLLACSCFVPAAVQVFAAGSNSVTDDMWNALAAALASDNVKNANYSGTNTVTVDDPTGDVLVAVQAYYVVLKNYILIPTTSSGSSTEYGYNYRTSSQVRDLVKTKMQSVMGDDYTTYNVASVLNFIGGNVTVSGDRSNRQNNVPTTTVKVTVNCAPDLMSCETLDDVPATADTYTYTVTHINSRRYRSGLTNYYYCTCSGTSENLDSAPYDISALRDLEAAIDANIDVIGAEQSEQIEMSSDVLSAAYTAVKTAYDAAVTAHGVLAVGHFFGDVATPLRTLEISQKIVTVLPLVEQLAAAAAEDFSEFSLGQLNILYQVLTQDYALYGQINDADVYAYFENGEPPMIVPADVEAKIAAVFNAIEIAELTELKPAVDADVARISAFDDDWVLATEDAETQLNAAAFTLAGYKTTLNGYKAENVAAVFGEDYVLTTLVPLEALVTYLLTANGYQARFEEFKAVYTEAFVPVTPDYTDDALYDVLDAKDAWYDSLQAFVAEVEAFDADFAAKLFTDAEAQMEAKIDSVYAILNARVTATVATAYELYQSFVAAYGYEINGNDDVTLENYGALKSVFGQVNPAHYAFLDGSAHSEISAETAAQYEAIRTALFAFINYRNTMGAADALFGEKYIIDDIVRLVSSKDVARNKDYVVTDEKVEAIIGMLEELLKSDTMVETLGFDLTGTVSGLLDSLYTNDFINTIVQYLYPMVAIEFAKVWMDIPDSVPVTDPVETTIYLTIDNMPTALKNLGLEVLPSLLATRIPDSDDPESFESVVKSQLAAVPNTAVVVKDENDEWVWQTNPWEDEHIYDAETGKLTLDWGVHDKESFLYAATLALSGVEDLLFALISNKEYRAEEVKVGTGSGSTEIACVPVTITVDPIALTMVFSANEGYDNVVAPILAALGVTDIPSGDDLTTVSSILDDGLITPLQSVLDRFADHPVDFLLRILPMLTYALEMNLIAPLLNNLETSIQYWADASYSAAGGCASDVMEDALNSKDDRIGINLGEILDLEDMGIRLDSLHGVIDTVMGLLSDAEEGEEAPTLELPPMDTTKMIMMGTEVNWIPGNHTRSAFAGVPGHETDYLCMEAGHPADVFLFLIDYLLQGIQNNDLLNTILDFINGSKTEEEAKIELPDMVNELLNNVIADKDNAIAAVVELLFPQTYDMPEKIEWITEGNIGADTYDEEWPDVDPETGYQTLWTQAKAMYMADHLEDFLNDLIVIFSEQLDGAETLDAVVTNALSGLYTAENANSVVEALKGLVGGIELPEAIAELGLLDQLGLDLTAWDDMSFSFADGDKTAFKNALITAIDPLAPLLRFMLAEQDITLTLLDRITVTAQGYDGYSYGLVPLMEALGCTGVKTTAAFIADKANIVKNIIDPVFTVLDHLAADPLLFIEDVIPSLLYFDKVNGIQVAVPHLLFALNVLVDTIRPLYDINLYALLEEKLGFDIRFLETDPINFIFFKLKEVLEESFGLELELDFSVENLTETLHYTDPIRFTSANGDDAYTIRLTAQGRADLLSRVLDYGVNEVIFSDNFDALIDLAGQLITDDDARAMLIGLLTILKDADDDIRDYHGVHDVALASLFWVFFGADSVTDATADYFYRYKDSNFYEILFISCDQVPAYVERVFFLLEEVYSTEYPAFLQIMEDRQNLLKPPYEYTEEEVEEVAGIGARFIRFFALIWFFFKNLFNR